MGQQTDFLIRDGVLKKYKGAGGTVVIPEGVEIIGEKAFYKRGNVQEVIMPAGIIEIRDKAFEQCDELESINLPGSLKEIGEKAFSGCGVKSVSIPDGVTKIGARAYENCRRMENVTIGSGLEEISEGMFSRCYRLQDVKIPENVSVIGQLAFEDSGLHRITIPGSIRIIKADAFRSCSHLTELYIDSIESWCAVSLGNAWSHPLYQTGTSGRWQRRQDGKLYVNGELVSEVQIPDGITALSGYRFCNCSNIRKVSIPESVKQIAAEIFISCRLEAVGVRSLEAWCAMSFTTENVYSYWNEVQGVYISDLASWCNMDIDDEGNVFDHFESRGNLYLKGVLVEDLVIPDGVTQIGRNAFAGCRSLKSVVIPDSVRIIKRGAFENCRNLRKVLLSNNLTEIGDEAFRSCERLSGITLPESLQRIGAAAFYNSHITGIKIPRNVTMIGESAFADCCSLEYAELGSCAFSRCTQLEEVELPETLREIHAHAFEGCTALKEITLPKSITGIP